MARVSPLSSPLLLADGIQIDGARLESGLLHIDLTRPTMPEIAKTVPGAGGAGANGCSGSVNGAAGAVAAPRRG